MDICTRYESTDSKDGIYVLHLDCADLRLCFINEEIVRMHVSFDRTFENASYVMQTEAWEDRCDAVILERSHVKPFLPEIQEEAGILIFTTAKIILKVIKDPLQICLLDKEGNELYSTASGSPFTRTLQGRITAYSKMKEEDCFYGFGEKTGPLNKNKLSMRERATDCMGYDPQKADTLYKHIPFYIRLDRDTKKAVGVFYHNFYESVFNMGGEKSNYWPRYSYWRAEGGDIDCYLFAGGTFASILNDYTYMTGRPVLLPKRALGYQGSSMYYAELAKDSDKAIESFVDTLHKEKFPLDGFHLSSGYTSAGNKRCVFTWNKERFSDPASFFHGMEEKHAQVVPNVKPGVLLCHPRLKEFQQEGAFVKDSKDPSENAVGRWWGGNGVFWDYTSPKGRDAWKKYLKKDILAYGTHSIWNDNCEYDSLLDEDCLCAYEGKQGTIAQLKPVMSNLMCRLASEAIQEEDPSARPYVVCRSGCAGIQKYAQTWCGDNATSWQTLRYNIPTITGMGLSGQPNEGADIGGFAGPAPAEELLVRWVQQGIFQPRFSIHSANSDNTVTDPCMYADSKARILQAIQLRYSLTPYLYSLEYEASQNGAPIMRALVYEFQQDPNVYDESFDYMFGDALLVANVLEPGASERSVYLPMGTNWYDLNDHYKCYAGGQTVTVPVTLDTIPMFLRAGHILAKADNQIMHMSSDHTKQLHLLLAPQDGQKTILYDDDGTSNDYQSGVFRRTVITDEMMNDAVRLHFQPEGTYPDQAETVHVEMIAKNKAPYTVQIEQHPLEHFLNRNEFEAAKEGWYYSMTNRTVEIHYANPAREYTLTVSFAPFDLIGM